MNAVVEHKDPMQTFQDKVVKKLRTDIGEMLPDDALAKLAQRAVDEHFFKERANKDSYGHVREREPSWFVEEVAKIADPLIKKAVAQWVADHEDQIEKAVVDYLSEQNLTLVAVAAMQAATMDQFSQMASQIVQQIKQGH